MRVRHPWRAISLALCLALCFAASPSRAQNTEAPSPSPYVERSDDDLLLLSVSLDSTVLSQDLEAYQYPGGVLVPLGEVCRLLELPVAASPKDGTADGILPLPNRKFHIDLRTHKASLAGTDLPFDASEAEAHKDDIYIDSRLLSTWFSLGL